MGLFLCLLITKKGAFYLCRNSYQILIFFFFLLLSAIPAGLDARMHSIEGAAHLGYDEYDISYSTGGGASANSFYQQYQLSTGFSGNLYNERGGLYRFGIIYNYKDYQNEIDGNRYSLNSGDLDWNGELTLALYHLKGFSVKFYAEEDESSQYSYTSIGGGGGVLAGGFKTDVEETVYRKRGFFGRMGVNGGPYYYFSYNSSESESIYGYKERIDSGNFSINSGTNWITVSKSQSDLGEWDAFEMNVGNVGTHFGKIGRNKGVSYKRYWYRISNWLNISTNYRYAKKNTSTVDTETNRLTFALKGKREQWTAFTFSTYGRSDSGNQSTYDLSIPFWLNTYPSAKSFLGLKSSYSERGVRDETTATESKGKSVNEEIRLWTRPKDDFALESKYSFAKSDADQADSVSHSFSIRGYTERRKQTNYGALYSFKVARKDDILERERSSYSHIVNGSLSYVIEPEKVINIGQSIAFFYDESGDLHEKSKSSSTSLNFRTNVGEKSNFSLAMSKFILKYDDGSSSVENELEMNFSSRISSKASFKANLDYDFRDSDLANNPSDEKYRSELKLTYKESRELTSITTMYNNKNLGSSYASEIKGISESLKYTIFRTGYSSRPLLNTSVGLSYYQEDNIIGKFRFGTYSIALDYYPMRYVRCGSAIRVRDDLEGPLHELNSRAYVAVKYPLLQITGSYIHRTYDNVYGSGLEEDKYKIDIAKRF